MNIKQVIEKFRNEDIAINVQTEQEWIEFMVLLEEHHEIRWRTSDRPTVVNLWVNNGSESCVAFSNRFLFSSSIKKFKKYDFKIITFQDFKKLYQKENNMKQFTKSDLKDYMKVVHRNGEERIVKGGILSNDCGDAVISQVLTNDLTWVYKGCHSNWLDIVEVYEPTLWGWNLLWKREEPKYMLLFPEAMFTLNYKLIDCGGVYDRASTDFNPCTDIKVMFTKEEIDAIPFNTDMFTPVEEEVK